MGLRRHRINQSLSGRPESYDLYSGWLCCAAEIEHLASSLNALREDSLSWQHTPSGGGGAEVYDWLTEHRSTVLTGQNLGCGFYVCYSSMGNIHGSQIGKKFVLCLKRGDG